VFDFFGPLIVLALIPVFDFEGRRVWLCIYAILFGPPLLLLLFGGRFSEHCFTLFVVECCAFGAVIVFGGMAVLLGLSAEGWSNITSR